MNRELPVCCVPWCVDRSWTARAGKRPMCRLHYDLWAGSSEARAHIGVVDPFEAFLKRIGAHDSWRKAV